MAAHHRKALQTCTMYMDKFSVCSLQTRN